jgi:hypothetical protein
MTHYNGVTFHVHAFNVTLHIMLWDDVNTAVTTSTYTFPGNSVCNRGVRIHKNPQQYFKGYLSVCKINTSSTCTDVINIQ